MTDPLPLTTPVEIDPLVGAQIGEYRVIQRIGRGGMGVVYSGEQPVIGKKVAIKVLLPEIANDDDATRRFVQEARSANQIGHRNIIDIFSFGQLPNGQQYLVMEYLEGQPLDELIRERAPLTAIETVHLLDDVASGLAAAHAAGILHRDLKPSNLFIVDQSDGSSFVKILDFGLAKMAERKQEKLGQDSSPATHHGTILGTPEYMAPEQARGEELDQRVDIYAFGVIAFEMLTGRLPFQGKSELETISKHLTEPVPSPADFQAVIPDLDALVMRLLAKDRDQRPTTLQLVRAEFKRVKRALESETTQMVYKVGPAKPPPLAPPVPSEPFAQTWIAKPSDILERPTPMLRTSRAWFFGALLATVAIAVTLGTVIALSANRGTAPAVVKDTAAPLSERAPERPSPTTPATPPPVSTTPVPTATNSAPTPAPTASPTQAAPPPPAAAKVGPTPEPANAAPVEATRSPSAHKPPDVKAKHPAKKSKKAPSEPGSHSADDLLAPED